MQERIFIDLNGQELIVKHRKSAVFFESFADIEKLNKYGPEHGKYICPSELYRLYNFEKEEFERFVTHCHTIAHESWIKFEPKEADSLGAEYDDYYDKEFDNNGSLSIRPGMISIEGPYTQLKSNGEVIRLIKFNKRKFESFVHRLNELITQ